MTRQVDIQPNLALWLRAYPLERYPLVPPGMVRLHHQVFSRFHLPQHALRHTFMSMFVGKYRSVAEASLQAGNSEDIIRRHYPNLKSGAEAERFFGIVPRIRPAEQK